jgi:hypothetical protein
MSPHGARIVADATVHGRISPFQFIEDSAHVFGRDHKLRRAFAIGTQLTGNVDGNTL